MTEPYVTTKAELLAHVDQNWQALDAFLSELSEAQFTTVRDELEWSVLDYVFHIAAWERSALYFLQGRPRHEAFGIDEAIYRRGSETGSADEVNAAVRKLHQNATPGAALAELRSVHAKLLAVLQPLTDADLQLPYNHYLPDEPGDYGDAPAINVVYGNTAHHFGEHLGWFKEMLAVDG